MRAYLVAIALIVALSGAIGGYQYLRFARLAGMDFSPAPVSVAAASVSTGQWTRHLASVGTIRAVHGVDLSAEASGQVTALDFDSGDRVEAGQLLAVLNDEVEQAARRNQSATVELARILYERDLKLIAGKSISQEQFDRSRADFERARAALAETEARIRSKHVRAPFAGTLGIRHIALGDYVEPGTLIASLQDDTRLDVDFTVPARHAPALRPGLPVAVQVDAFPGRSFAAELSAVDTRVDAGTRNLLLRARLREVDGLLPGMFATVQIDLGAAEAVVTVPETAVTYSLQGDTVFVLEPHPAGGTTATARIVRVGDVRDGQAAILAGLQAGERIVTGGQNKLFRGVKVVVDERVAL